MGKKSTVTFIGESLIDLIRNPNDCFTPKCAGGLYNSAIIAAKLGLNIIFLGHFSNDFFGSMLLKNMKRYDIDFRFSQFNDKPTAISIPYINSEKKTNYSIYLKDSTLDESLHDKNILRAINYSEGAVIGSLGLVSDSMYKNILKYLELIEKDYFLIFDPNVRPGLISRTIGRLNFLSRFENILSNIDILKLSKDDISWIYPDMEIEDIIKSIKQRGVELVIITNESEKVCAYSRDLEICVLPEKKVEGDFIGAGDAFLGSIVNSFVSFGKKIYTDKECLIKTIKKANEDVYGYIID